MNLLILHAWNCLLYVAFFALPLRLEDCRGRNVLDRVDCSVVMEVSWNNRLYLVGIYFVSLGCVGTATRVVQTRSWNPGAIGERTGPGMPSWFYILRPVCSSIAPGFCDCAIIA